MSSVFARWRIAAIVATLVVAPATLSTPVAARASASAARDSLVSRGSVVPPAEVVRPVVSGAPGPSDATASKHGADAAGVPGCDPAGNCATGRAPSIELPPPTGQVTIGAGATYTSSTIVSVDVEASGATSGFATIELSNDGTHWVLVTHSMPVEWSLVDPASGGDGDTGMKTVHVRITDEEGIATTLKQTILFDPDRILRYAGADRFATAAAISAATFAPGVGVAYIATADNFPDALAGAAAAGMVKGPVLLVNASGPLNPATAAELTRLRPTRIVVLGGSGVVSDAVKTALLPYATSGTILRYAGADRFATAAAISAATFAPGVGVAYIATADNFPDALAGAAAAGMVKGPVLLVNASGPLNPATAAELTRLRPTRIVVLGGSGVVSDAVKTALLPYATSGTILRYAGADRFATAAAISAATFAPGVGVAYIATADNFPDALAGAAAAGMVKGPVLLVNASGPLNPATAAELTRLRPTRIVVLGGSGVVSAAVLSQLPAYVGKGAELPLLPAYFHASEVASNAPRDANGIVMVAYTWGLEYNPVTVSQLALGQYASWLQTGSTAAWDDFIRQVNWLVTTQQPDGRWLYTFAFAGQPVPWWSAMAEGQAISALVRAYRATGDARYATAATRASTTFTRLQSDRGVTSIDRGDRWYEEYMPPYSPHTLNGFMFALVGVWEYHATFGDSVSGSLLRDGLHTLQDNLSRFDTGTWSCYSLLHLTGCSYASVHYHTIHIEELRYWYSLTATRTFRTYADRWQAYLGN